VLYACLYFTANSPDIIIAGTTTIRPIRERERETIGNQRRSAVTNYKRKSHREKKDVLYLLKLKI
jgi:hypothetical protein